MRSIRARHRGSRAAAMSKIVVGSLAAARSIAARARRPRVDAAHARVTPDTIAKFLFTSGSTGMPKGVINTQRMWCSNQAMIASALQFFADEPPVIVDWAPWHHTAGGNHDVGLVLYNGGTMYIDDGKPLPGAIEETVRNLREIAPTWYFTVPKGYEALLPYLPRRRRAAREFLRRLKVLWFAGAGLAQHVFDEMEGHGASHLRRATSCSSPASARPRPRPMRSAACGTPTNAANIGLPPPGLEREARAAARASRGAAARARTSRPATGASRSSPPRPSTRKASTGSATRCKFDDPARPGEGPAVRGPHRRGLQARDRHLGQRRAAARRVHRALRAVTCATS